MGTGSLEGEVRVKAIVLRVVHLLRPGSLMLWVTTLLHGKYILPNLPALLHLWVDKTWIIQKDGLVEVLEKIIL